MSAARTELFALTTDQVDLVFPLAREADSQMTLEDWRHFAETSAVADPSERRPPGILLASRNGQIRGLVAYEVSTSGTPDRVLTATRTIIIDRTRERHMALDMLGGLLQIAETEQCTRIYAELPPPSRWLHTHWSDPGGQVFRMPVECFALPSPADTDENPKVTGVVTLRPRT